MGRRARIHAIPRQITLPGGLNTVNQHEEASDEWQNPHKAIAIAIIETGANGRMGCKRASRTGSVPIVKKKFQWVPYSDSCSYVSSNECFRRRPDWANSRGSRTVLQRSVVRIPAPILAGISAAPWQSLASVEKTDDPAT